MKFRFDVLGKSFMVQFGDEIFDPGIELQDFTGLGGLEDFLEWVRKKANLWFDNLNARRARSGKVKIVTWTTLKKHLRAKYIPCDYQLEKFIKLTSLSQGTMSASEYTSEFENLRFICDFEETEIEKIARFIRGLDWPIYKKVKSSPSNSFSDVCNLALKFESQPQEEEGENLKCIFQRFGLSQQTQEEEEEVERVVE
ncbi:hypothetical protein POM88_045173 [Heracleum sosnowskyi]|uniref:Retrotransposon gag domain-containing protein n=1 Tax=Heracleum sosnowskyi TaxID=360622 RepID=A0AAD8H599_9APIA|nr:hypothetical protein POM88_045173 [Heracleum sosnowskyi]